MLNTERLLKHAVQERLAVTICINKVRTGCILMARLIMCSPDVARLFYMYQSCLHVLETDGFTNDHKCCLHYLHCHHRHCHCCCVVFNINVTIITAVIFCNNYTLSLHVHLVYKESNTSFLG